MEKSPTVDGGTVPFIHAGKTGVMRQYQRPGPRPVWTMAVSSTLRVIAGLLIFELEEISKRYLAALSAADQEKATVVSAWVVNSEPVSGVISVIGELTIISRVPDG